MRGRERTQIVERLLDAGEIIESAARPAQADRAEARAHLRALAAARSELLGGGFRARDRLVDVIADARGFGAQHVELAVDIDLTHALGEGLGALDPARQLDLAADVT